MVADDDLSMTDLVCLVAVVPNIIVLRAMIGSDTFPNNISITNMFFTEAFEPAAVLKLLHSDESVHKTVTVVSELWPRQSRVHMITNRGRAIPQVN